MYKSGILLTVALFIIGFVYYPNLVKTNENYDSISKSKVFVSLKGFNKNDTILKDQVKISMINLHYTPVDAIDDWSFIKNKKLVHYITAGTILCKEDFGFNLDNFQKGQKYNIKAAKDIASGTAIKSIDIEQIEAIPNSVGAFLPKDLVGSKTNKDIKKGESIGFYDLVRF